MKEIKDTTGNLFQAAGMSMPFSFILSDAEMPAVDYNFIDKNQISLFGDLVEQKEPVTEHEKE